MRLSRGSVLGNTSFEVESLGTGKARGREVEPEEAASADRIQGREQQSLGLQTRIEDRIGMPRLLSQVEDSLGTSTKRG